MLYIYEKWWKMKFSKMVEEVRIQLFITQEQLAKLLGVSFSTVNRWEKGYHEPNLLIRRKFDDLCKKHGIKFEESDE